MNRVLFSCLFDFLSVGEATSLMAYKACVDEEQSDPELSFGSSSGFPETCFSRHMMQQRPYKPASIATTIKNAVRMSMTSLRCSTSLRL